MNVDALLAQLREALREELRAEVRAELISELQGGKAASRGNLDPKKSKAAPKPAKGKPGPKPKAAPAAALKVKPGQRRMAEDIGDAATAIMAYLRKNPGSRVDQIAAALGAKVKDLQLPVQMLLEHKEVKKAGRLRGTTYTAKARE